MALHSSRVSIRLTVHHNRANILNNRVSILRLTARPRNRANILNSRVSILRLTARLHKRANILNSRVSILRLTARLHNRANILNNRVSILRLTVRLHNRANILRSRASIRPTADLRIASRILLSIRSSSRMLLKKGEMRWWFQMDPSSGCGSIRG